MDSNELSAAMMDIMDAYPWVPASIARFVLTHDIDYEFYFEKLS